MRNGHTPYSSHPFKGEETNVQDVLFTLNCDLARWASQFEHFVALPSAPEAPRGRLGLFAEVTRAIRLSDPQELEPLLESQRSRPSIFLLGYELGRAWLNLPSVEAPRGQPLGLFLELGECIELDGVTKQLKPYGSHSYPKVSSKPSKVEYESICWEKITSDASHSDGIHKVHEAIKRGDIYQANLTRRYKLHGQFDTQDLFSKLLASNPVGHMAWVRADSVEILSNTMETLLEFDPSTRLAASFPIKGTQPRQDQEHTPPPLDVIPKERAEHVMIVDLIRNDLGKVCVPGTVQVPSLLGIEGYKGVWHGVSRVEGIVRPDASLYELIAALFPGGSITGAPKRRSVEILSNLESEARGFYTGSIGIVWPDKRVSASILIRTLVRDDDGWSLNVGGGIVIDSVAERELQEMQEKASAIRTALETLGT